jgi:hypothetical protein
MLPRGREKDGVQFRRSQTADRLSHDIMLEDPTSKLHFVFEVMLFLSGRFDHMELRVSYCDS